MQYCFFTLWSPYINLCPCRFGRRDLLYSPWCFVQSWGPTTPHGKEVMNAAVNTNGYFIGFCWGGWQCNYPAILVCCIPLAILFDLHLTLLGAMGYKRAPSNFYQPLVVKSPKYRLKSPLQSLPTSNPAACNYIYVLRHMFVIGWWLYVKVWAKLSDIVHT